MRILLLGLVIFNCAVSGAAEQVDSATKQAIFTQKLYPFMRKNCAECHDENAIYPSGPTHSQSNPTLAYEKFSKYVSLDEAGGSRIMKMVAGKHFCTEHQYNCNRADQIVKEYSELLSEYIFNVRKASLNKSAPRGEGGTIITTDLTEFQIEEPTMFSPPVIFADVNQPLKIPLGNEVLATLEFETMRNNFVRVTSLKLSGRGIYKVKGLSILVNDQPLLRKTGFERVDRYFLFVHQQEQPVAMAHPIFALNPSDTLRLAVVQMNKVKTFPSQICAKVGTKEKSMSYFSLVGNYTQIHRLGRVTDTATCELVESKIDFQNPQRSVLLEELVGSGANGADYLRQIENLIQSYK